MKRIIIFLCLSLICLGILCSCVNVNASNEDNTNRSIPTEVEHNGSGRHF